MFQGMVLASVAGGLGAPEPPREAADPADSWRYSITPYLWLYGIDGEGRIRNTTAEFEADFGDILENLDFALMARFEAFEGSFGFYLDPAYGRLESDADVGPAEEDVETDLVLVDFGMFYRAVDHRDSDGRASAADLSLGGRYVYLKNEIDFDLLSDRAQSRDFVDLTLGARYAMDLTDRFGVLVGGDVGGFGIGSSSEFAWNAQGLAYLRVGGSGRIWAGYRALDLDQDDGGASGADLRFHGPIVGFEFQL